MIQQHHRAAAYLGTPVLHWNALAVANRTKLNIVLADWAEEVHPPHG